MRKANVSRKVGKIRKPLPNVDKIKSGQYLEEHEWRKNGDKDRFIDNSIYFNLIKGINRNNKSPKILILGPGIGEEVIELNKILKILKLNPEIESLGLTNQLTKKAKEVIKKDHSKNLALEEIDPNNPEHKKLINSLKEKFDYILAPTSIGIHTRYPAYNCFLCALALKPKGEARITILSEDFSQSYIDLYKHQLETKEAYGYKEREISKIEHELRFAQRMKSQTKTIVPTIYRMLNSYLKKDIREQYTVDIQPDSFNLRSSILYIKRNY